MDTKKKYLKYIIGGVVVVIVAAALVFTGYALHPGSELAALPTPEIGDGIRGEQFGVDKNINESTIDNYLHRSDSVYRDMRLLEDPGNYEAIGGDRYLSGYVSGFEIVPLPYLVNVSGLPDEVGETYSGKTLFTQKGDEYIPRYEESLQILQDLFPKDKYIFPRTEPPS